MIVDMQINLCPLPQKRPSRSIAAVRVAESVSFVITLMAVLLLAHAPQARERALTAHHGFGDVAHWAGVFESPDRVKWQKPDEVVRALDLKPGQTVIDIGAGTGYFTRRFAKAVGPSGAVIGLDVEPGMVNYMKADAKKLGLQNYHARVVKADDPELSPNSADVIFFCDTLHHVDDRLAYLRKLAPALKPGGRIAVVDFMKDAPEGPPKRMKISREQMMEQFRKAGYDMVREHKFLPYQYFLEFEPAAHG
jgi:arsenite methyltransferase